MKKDDMCVCEDVGTITIVGGRQQHKGNFFTAKKTWRAPLVMSFATQLKKL